MLTLNPDKVIGLDIAAYKSGVAVGDASTKTLEECFRIDFDNQDCAALSDEDRAEQLVDRLIAIIKRVCPYKVLMDDTRIGFGSNNKGHQEYYNHGNLRVVARYCLKNKIEVQFLGSTSVKSKIYGKTWKSQKIGKKEIQSLMQCKFVTFMPTDDHSDAAALVYCEFLNR